jgi:hypothetical protein
MADLAALADMIDGDPEWFVNVEFDDADLIAALRLAHAMRWRPIAEAPIPAIETLPEYWCFHCLLQDARGIVGEGFARYSNALRKGTKAGEKHLRWYFGDGTRDSRLCPDPKYFMPLPAKRED